MSDPTRPRTAVVTLVHGRHQHLELQQRSLSASSRQPDVYVVVAMDDDELLTWEPDSGIQPTVIPISAEADQLPLAAARNIGALAAMDHEAEVIVFLDVDVLAGDTLVEAYADAVVRHPDVVWSGPVTYLDAPPEDGYDVRRLGDLDAPHPARPAPKPGEEQVGAEADLFWSLSFAVHRSVWARTGGFCEEYAGYGGEDTDFAQVVLREGLELGWLGSARAYHQHHDSPHDDTDGPPDGHVDDLLRNGAIFAERWGRWPMTGWFERLEAQGLVARHGDGWVDARGR